MIYFTSDSHLCHQNIIEYCNRPWADVEAMNEGLIAPWNAQVSPDDVVYFLGDFAFANTFWCRKVFDRLNGVKHLIKGNHDANVTELP